MPRDEETIIAESAAMRQVLALLPVVAASDLPVLIEGETGTGKEVIADRIMALSGRRSAPCVKISPAEVSDQLFESELFGHVRGSFTGAIRDRRGVFQQADRGTVFIDDIDDFPLHLQAKVLRVLEARELRPVGSDVTLRVDVRLLCATKVDLLERVEAGRFRRDLYYRINVLPLRLPPLRERPEDIEPLFRAFLGDGVGWDPCVLGAALRAHSWPGNVREVRNVADRMRLLCRDVAEARVMLGSVAASDEHRGDRGLADRVLSGRLTLREAVEVFEAELIQAALERTEGRQAAAARLLGIPATTLADKIHRLGNQAPPGTPSDIP